MDSSSRDIRLVQERAPDPSQDDQRPCVSISRLSLSHGEIKTHPLTMPDTCKKVRSGTAVPSCYHVELDTQLSGKKAEPRSREKENTDTS